MGYTEVAAGRAYYSEGDAEADLNIGQYHVVLNGTGDLGLKYRGGCSCAEYGSYLSVREVQGGLAAAWNSSWPQKAMKVGHMIILVNGKKIKMGSANTLEREL